MDSIKVGSLIYKLRKEKGMTQKQLAELIHISDKTISKWERGAGCPDISLLTKLSALLGVNIEAILNGDLSLNDFVGGNMKKTKYYVCPDCGNLVFSTGGAAISCCGRHLEAEELKRAPKEDELLVEQVENEWYIKSTHPMTKEHYISFVAYATGGELHVVKMYPEWDMQLRMNKRGHGMLIWYCVEHGMFYQLI